MDPINPMGRGNCFHPSSQKVKGDTDFEGTVLASFGLNPCTFTALRLTFARKPSYFEMSAKGHSDVSLEYVVPNLINAVTAIR